MKQSEHMETAPKMWERLISKRRRYIERAIDGSSLTIPHIAPPMWTDSFNNDQDLINPWQSVGSAGVKNIASKFMLTLFPPNLPFFKLTFNDIKLAEASPADRAEADASLVQIENLVQNEIETMGFSPKAHTALVHLAITGNAILQVPNDGPVRFWPLSSYVAERDIDDNLLTLVFRQEVSIVNLPIDLQEKAFESVGDPDGKERNKEISLYTVLKRTGPDKYETYQELGKQGNIVPDSEGTFTEDDMPYIVLRWTHDPGSAYGRSLVEELMGDLRSLENLSESIVQGAAMAAHHNWLLKPGGSTRMRDLLNAPNGAIIAGDIADISPLQMNKGSDYALAGTQAAVLAQRLGASFLKTEVRQAERVTAEEIRALTQELQENLGGVFAIQSSEFQLPLVKRVMARMKKQGKLPDLPKDLIEPKIVTGIQGLGRGQEFNRLLVALQSITTVVGPAAIPDFFDQREVILSILNGSGVTADDLVLTQEEIGQIQQAKASQQLVANLGPDVVKGLSKNNPEGFQGEQPPQ